MRIALCFYGLVGGKIGKNGKGENLDPTIAYDLYKKHILSKNDNVDVFIHSWSIEEKLKLIKLYNPKKSYIEKQKQFSNASKQKRKKTIKEKLKNLLRKIFKKKSYQKYNQLQKILKDEPYRVYSRWYSSMKSLELKKEYEESNNFKYDVVMITRLDVGFFTDLHLNKYDMNFFYASHRNDVPSKDNNFQANHENHFKETQFQDLWFFSNSENMDKFANLYNEIENYELSSHVSSKQHVDKYIGKNKIKYTLYRWFDYELIRRKFF